MTKDVMTVSDEEFVKLWLDGYKRQTGLLGLVKEQGWVYVTASARASVLRKAGVKLPTMRVPRQKNNVLTIDAKALNKLVVAELGEEALHWRNR